MSLGIIIKATEGLVLAAESRVTLTFQANQPGIAPMLLNANFDNANKLLSFNEPFDKFGVVTYGLGALNLRTAQSLIPEFEKTLLGSKEKLTVHQFAEKLSKFFVAQWELLMDKNFKPILGQGMTFNVAGFDDNEPYGTIYQFEIPLQPKPIEQNTKVNGQYAFGISGGGQHEIMSRLMVGYDQRLIQILIQNGIATADQISRILLPALEPLKLQVPFQFMPLQDCVNLAVLLIKTTIEAQSLAIGVRGCGGAIDVAVIKKNEPLKFIPKKDINVN